MINFIHQDILDQELGQNILTKTHIQVEGETSIQNQQLFMDQIINHNPIFYHLEET